MVIAVNARFLLKDQLEGYGYFTREVFRILVKKFPQHEFYFLFDRPYGEEFIFADNVHGVVVSPPARHPLLWKYWYDIKIPLVLKKIRATVFVSADGFCSLTTGIPQCLVVHDLGFLHYPQAYKKSHAAFYKGFTPKFLKKAASVATVTEFSKRDLVQHYPIRPEKIGVVYSASKETFHPLSFAEKQSIREKYTDGCEFFIYVGAIQPRKNVISLLKAFSIFKRRLKSNMKLVFAGRMAWKTDEFSKLLRTYKYREDIVLTGYVEETALAQLVGSAYALVYPSYFEGFGVPVLEAMKCNVAVLTSEKTSMEEVAGEAALYFDPNNYEDMAEKLMLIYKDENLRNRLIEKGKAVSATYTWERTAALLWKSISKAADQSQLDNDHL